MQRITSTHTHVPNIGDDSIGSSKILWDGSNKPIVGNIKDYIQSETKIFGDGSCELIVMHDKPFWRGNEGKHQLLVSEHVPRCTGKQNNYRNSMFVYSPKGLIFNPAGMLPVSWLCPANKRVKLPQFLIWVDNVPVR